MIQTCDRVEGHSSRTDIAARPDVGTRTEVEVSRGGHRCDSILSFRLPLWQECQLRHLRADEEVGRRIWTSGDAGTTADTCRVVHRLFGYRLGDRDRVGVGRSANRCGDMAAGGDDSIEGRSVDDEISDHGETPSMHRFESEVVTIGERPKMLLARRGVHLRSVWNSVHEDTTTSADSLSTVVVEDDRFDPSVDEISI